MIDAYLAYHKLAWAPTTLATAKYTLKRYLPTPEPHAESLWLRLDSLGAYSKLTVWSRCAHYYDWLLENSHVKGENIYKAFAKKNRRLFRGAYRPERLKVTFEEAQRRLATLPDGDVRRTANRMLSGAQRWSDTSCGDGLVVGKGQKVRQDFSGEAFQGAAAPYHTVYRALKSLGLKPHTLRKLALNRLVERGATAADLMAVAGWASMSTAASYLQPKETKRLKEMLR